MDIPKFVYRNGWWECFISGEPDDQEKMFILLLKEYGPLGDRWEFWKGWYKFKNEADVTWFTLKWGHNERRE